jgi:hypothetical protein
MDAPTPVCDLVFAFFQTEHTQVGEEERAARSELRIAQAF